MRQAVEGQSIALFRTSHKDGQEMTPETLAKSGSEHGEQRALFAWANMAAKFGFAAAWDDKSYSVAGHAQSFGRIASPPVAALHRLHAIPNGGYRDKITAGKLKAEGVKTGVPDIFLPLPQRPTEDGYCDYGSAFNYCGLYIELKRAKSETQRAGTISPEQQDWVAYLRQVGYAVSVVFGWRDAAKTIEQYVNQCGGANASSTNDG